MSRRVPQRFPPPPGWTSKHERKRDAFGNPTGLAFLQGDMTMAPKKGDVVARGSSEVAAELSRRTVIRDALVDPQPHDIIPDLEEKGYHVGETAQPAEPVIRSAGGDVEFESTSEAPESKFSGPLSFAEQVKANDALEQERSDDWRPATAAILTDPDDVAKAKAEYDRTNRAARTESTTGGGG